MILAVDVGYLGLGARAVGILFQRWDSEIIDREVIADIAIVNPYIPGEFFKRELPCIEKVLELVHEPLECIIIDGYVSLGESEMPGLGAKLWERLGRNTPVIGVAKSKFLDAPEVVKLHRGKSLRPLFITAIGMPLEKAKSHILEMQGKYRIPKLLKMVDQSSRLVYS